MTQTLNSILGQPLPQQVSSVDLQSRDARRAPRRRVCVPGLIGFPGYRMTVPCRLLDMSSTGIGTMIIEDNARRRRSALELPDRILLIMTHERLEVDCLIRWRDGERFGAQFTSMTRRRIEKPL